MNRITPFVKRMRAKGGTIYTFSSAVEDIGLNINERNNQVKISHFALLNIPNVAEASAGYLYNTFNIRNIAGCWEYEQNSPTIKDGRVIIAESFQNYALNLESVLLNRDEYNPELTTTISERVFWKWLKETGAIRWSDPSLNGNGNLYWKEQLEGDDYIPVVKYIGLVSAGNVRIDTFGTYNETYILVPTSHGKTPTFFKQIEDDNYYHGLQVGNLGENILGRESYTKPHPDALSMKAYYDFVDSSTQVGTDPYYMYYDNSTGTYSSGWWYTAEGISPYFNDNTYIVDSSNYINSGIYDVNLKFVGANTIEFKRSKIDCVSLELDIEGLKSIFNDPNLTYDNLAVEHSEGEKFEFNSVLIYYSIYNSTGDAILATNLLGVLFLDAPSGNTSEIISGYEGILLPSLEKIQSTAAGFGTAYSLRLNIKTDNMIDDTGAVIVDAATSDQLMADQWQEAIQNLSSAVNILAQQGSTLNYISGQYALLKEEQTQIVNDVAEVIYRVNDISRDIVGDPYTIPIFSEGDDPLVESSIYMRWGNIGLFNAFPTWDVQVDKKMKTKDIYIEKNIRDVSGNILIGYGSPISIGDPSLKRDINIYVGNDIPAIKIDVSNNVTFDGSLFTTNGKEVGKGTFVTEASVGKNFKWVLGNLDVSQNYVHEASLSSYVKDSSYGEKFFWSNGYLDISAGGGGGTSLFDDGTYVAPSISFVSNPSFGFYKENDEIILINKSQTILSCTSTRIFVPTQLQLEQDLYAGNSKPQIAGADVKETGMSIFFNDITDFGEIWFKAQTDLGSAWVFQMTEASIFSKRHHYFVDGTAAKPGLSFANDPDTGIYRVANNQIGIAAGGSSIMRLSNSQIVTTVPFIDLYSSNAYNDYNIQTGSITLSDGNYNNPSLSFITNPSIGFTKINLPYGPSIVACVSSSTPLIISKNIMEVYALTKFNDGSPTAKTMTSLNSSHTGINFESGGDYGRIIFYLMFEGEQTWQDTGFPVLNLGCFSIDASAPLRCTTGSLSDPGIAFNVNNGGTGFSCAGTSKEQIRVSSQGNEIIRFQPNRSEFNTRLLINPGMQSATYPGLAFSSGDNSTGFFGGVAVGRINVTSDGIYRFCFNNDGNFHAQTGIVAPSSPLPSDKRLKYDIEYLDESNNIYTNIVNSIRGVSYTSSKDKLKHIGYIAQEIETILPQVVIEYNDVFSDNSSDMYKAINYQEIIPIITEAFKEQNKKIEYLEKLIEQQTNVINNLIKKIGI